MDTSEEYANMYEHAVECQIAIPENEGYSYLIKTKSKYVWVPHADLLLDIITRECHARHWRAAIRMITKTEDTHLKWKHDSLEKSALATIMYVCYHKKWNGAEWVQA